MAIKRVLIVDDDSAFVQAMTDLLTRAGCSVTAVRDGGQALVAMGREPPDAVLLDLMMEPVNGWELLASKRSQPALSGIPVVVVSAWGNVPQALPPCVRRFLDKPIEPAAAARAVLEVLGGPSHAGANPGG